jgi:hypothetical protein
MGKIVSGPFLRASLWLRPQDQYADRCTGDIAGKTLVKLPKQPSKPGSVLWLEAYVIDLSQIFDVPVK